MEKHRAGMGRNGIQIGFSGEKPLGVMQRHAVLCRGDSSKLAECRPDKRNAAYYGTLM